MEEIKIKNYESDHLGQSFPSFATLGRKDCADKAAAIATKFNIPNGLPGLELVKKISSLSEVCAEFDANQANFRMSSVLTSKGIVPNGWIYLNWYRFDKIDKILIVDFEEYFHDIWYPDSDDVDVFDESLDWILSIGHDGRVKVATPIIL